MNGAPRDNWSSLVQGLWEHGDISWPRDGERRQCPEHQLPAKGSKERPRADRQGAWVSTDFLGLNFLISKAGSF